jgi:anaerobic selenocysteine-containing dehydrogenase
MERRDFFKLSALLGATATLEACRKPAAQMIRFVPEEEFTPGVATWRPSLCTMCAAACGLSVRVMDGDAEVVRNGRRGLVTMGLAKKFEGNPVHPVNQGRLCPRGQAGLQITYHPDRLSNPLKLTGPRGSGQYQEVSWDEAIKVLLEQLSTPHAGTLQGNSLAFITGRLFGQRRVLVEKFLAALGAPPPIVFEPFDDEVLRRANELSFGRHQLPTYDLGRANYVLSFGADFLGTWGSPVANNLAYGLMRQGRLGQRGKFIQVEPRMSQTGANADEWLPARPGAEGVIALGIIHILLREKLVPASTSRASNQIEGWAKGLPDYTPESVASSTGIAVERIVRLAHKLAAHRPAVVIIGGTPLAHTNGLFNALAVNALNGLLGSVEKPGGIFFTPDAPVFGGPTAHPSSTQLPTLTEKVLSGSADIRVLLLDKANPVYASPPAWRVREALDNIPFIASFGCFLDETSSLADLILPDHAPLESWLDGAPESGSMHATMAVTPPAVRPLHNTRAMPDVLLAVAHELGGKVAAALPWKTYEEGLRKAVEPLHTKPGSIAGEDADDFWRSLIDHGVWTAPASEAFKASPPASASAISSQSRFEGSAEEYPFHFLPYASQQLYDGSLAHLPWLQEMPDVLSTTMWGSWVEINTKTAASLGIQQGDLLEVTSSHGSLRAPALVSPGIAPDVIAMPAGQGHEQFSRYAQGRGANPFKILAPLVEPETNSLAWAATRVKVKHVGKGSLTLFAAEMREKPYEHERR